MIIDLNKGLKTAEVDMLNFVDIEQVVHTANSAKELAKQLACMSVQSPSKAYDLEDGEYIWDYKDGNRFLHGLLSEIIGVIPEVQVIEESPGPKYWFIKFTFKGEESGFGPGYKGE